MTPFLTLLADTTPAEAAAPVEDTSALWELVQNFVVIMASLWAMVLNIGEILLPWLPLIAWVAFWAYAVNWVTLRRILLFEGGWIGLLLLGFVAILVWATVAPPADGYHRLLGLTVGNYVGKTIYVTALVVIAFLAGSVQLSGATGDVAHFEEEEAALTSKDDGHH